MRHPGTFLLGGLLLAGLAACDDFVGVEVENVVAVSAQRATLSGPDLLDSDFAVQVTVQNLGDLPLEFDTACSWIIETVVGIDANDNLVWAPAYVPQCPLEGRAIVHVPPGASQGYVILAKRAWLQIPGFVPEGFFRVQQQMVARWSIVRTIPVSEAESTSNAFPVTL